MREGSPKSCLNCAIWEEILRAKKRALDDVWAQLSKHPMTAILCEFNDSSAFYSLTMPEMDALRGSIAGWRNEQGTASLISQFVTLEPLPEDTWKIHIAFPKKSVMFNNLLSKSHENNKLIVGVINGKISGFCAVNKDEIALTLAQDNRAATGRNIAVKLRKTSS